MRTQALSRRGSSPVGEAISDDDDIEISDPDRVASITALGSADLDGGDRQTSWYRAQQRLGERARRGGQSTNASDRRKVIGGAASAAMPEPRRSLGGSAPRPLVQPPPAQRTTLHFERAEAALVGHLGQVLHPVAEVDIAQPGELHLLDVVEDQQVPETARRRGRGRRSCRPWTGRPASRRSAPRATSGRPGTELSRYSTSMVCTGVSSTMYS